MCFGYRILRVVPPYHDLNSTLGIHATIGCNTFMLQHEWTRERREGTEARGVVRRERAQLIPK